MNRQSTRTTMWAVAAASALIIALPAAAQQEFSAEEIQALSEKMMAAGQPGPEHERLAALVGSWDMEMKVWPQLEAEPVVARATVESRMILGGRFLIQEGVIDSGMFAGEMMSILGFDRRSGEYTNIALDTTGTYWVTAQGQPSEDGSKALLSGTSFDPFFDTDQVYDIVIHFVDDDTVITELFFKDMMHAHGGEPFKMVETTARRRR